MLQRTDNQLLLLFSCRFKSCLFLCLYVLLFLYSEAPRRSRVYEVTCPAFLDFHGAGDVMFDITGLNQAGEFSFWKCPLFFVFMDFEIIL